MHELSIAQAVLAIAERHAAGRRVIRVEARVGHLRQVVPDSLQFAFELLTAGTAMDGALLQIEEVPAVGRCRNCGAEGRLEGFPLSCPSCASLDLEVIAGEELLVEALELEDEQAAGPEDLAASERMGRGSHV